MSYWITVGGLPRCLAAELFPALGLQGLCSARDLTVIEESAARLFAEWPEGGVRIELGHCPASSVSLGDW